MGLDKYSEKRDFEKTPEPSGDMKPRSGPLRFVIQKHKATRLHYDLRLELQGTLKSWAVPKGPSMNPQDKRLSIMVEDHPIDYRHFEGVIPEGNYGAGSVMIWDEGHYLPVMDEGSDPEQVLSEQLAKGHLTFILSGHKLKGEFGLIKLKRAEENAWLLIKAGDQYASDEDVTREDRSVTTGRSLEEIAQDLDAPTEPVEEINLSGAPVGSMPRNVTPMLATLVQSPFDKAGWLFEIKWDGYRAIAEVEQGQVRLYSRNLLSFNETFPALVDSLKNLGHDAVIDGEIVVVDDAGLSRFGWLQDYQRKPRGQLVYYVFDLLHLDGHDLTGLPLKRRKDILRNIIGSIPNVSYSGHIEETGSALYHMAQEKGLEGIIAKDSSSPYRPGIRGREWLKVKARKRLLAVVGGFTEPRGGRKHIGALVLGYYDNGRLKYIGHTGSGFDDASLADAYTRLKPLSRDISPFAVKPVTNAPVQWVEPQMVCEVVFSDWTEDGVLRAPVFAGFREDVSPSQAKMEPREAPPESGVYLSPPVKDAQQVTIGGRSLSLTNLNKVFWPDEGYTKGDVIAYYRDIAGFILPYLKDRPESLHRHPNGITESSFYQKNMAEQPPEWVDTVRIRHEAEDKEIEYLLCQEEATLVYMANLGCIEINPWNSRVGSLNNPDYIVLDLDPEDIGFDRVIEAALAVRGILDEAGAISFCKTSGASGIHIYVPLGTRYSYSDARRFAELIANLAHRKTSGFTSIERSPAKRQGKVYLDFLQNLRGQTLASAYCIRPQPGATVSTPLAWDEVRPELRPDQFTIGTVPKRLEAVGDLFSGVLGPGVDIGKCLERLSGADI